MAIDMYLKEDSIMKTQEVSTSASNDKSTRGTIGKRRRKLSAAEEEAVAPKKRASMQKSTFERNDDKSSNGSNDNKIISNNKSDNNNKTKKSNRRRKEEKALEFTWICTECRQSECAADPDSVLIVCEGQCNRPFHIFCAGLTSVPNEDEKWICMDCKKERHQCAVCHEYGADGVDVHKCQKKDCGLFFHESCLNMYDVDIEVEDSNDNYNDGTDDGSQRRAEPKFTCPAHACWTCSGGMPPREEEQGDVDKMVSNGKKGKSGKKGKKAKCNDMCISFKEKKESLFRCMECPISYHLSCIHPGAKFHELAMLCHEHAATSELPYLDLSQSMQGSIERDADVMIQKMNKSKSMAANVKKVKNLNGMSNPFLPGIKGSQIASVDVKMGKLLSSCEDCIVNSLSKNNAHTFCLPVGVRKEVYSKPPVYTHVHTNQYDSKNRPKRHPPSEEVCKCVPKKDGKVICDENCMNGMIFHECVGNGASKSGQKNPYWNCNHGPNCGNRALGRRQFAKCKPQREQGKGWGLVTINGVKKNGLVQEYVGEIINEKIKKERLEDWVIDHPNDPNFYIMALESGWYIDARVKGNLSRFINHSCMPNCKLIPVNVAGYIRVGIYAMRDIRPGEFLSYDYQFDTSDKDKFVCRCGAENCRGTMKGGNDGSRVREEKKKTKKDAWMEAKIKFEKDKKFLQDLEKDQLTRLNQVGANLPGEVKEGSRTVAAGPDLSAVAKIRANNIFLWRNVMKGADFSGRLLRISSPRTKMTSRKVALPKVDMLSELSRISSWN